MKGESLNSTYKGWFELSNFDIDLAGAGAGTAAFSPLTLTPRQQYRTGAVAGLAASGDHLNGATLIGVTDAVGQAKVYQLDLADVLVTNVEHHADLITEAGPTLTLDYSKIELETFTPDGTGGTVPEGQFGFDLATNMAGVTVPSAGSGRERRGESASCGLFHAHRRAQRRLAGQATHGLVRDRGVDLD